MSFMLVWSNCVVCGDLMAYNPHKVPSMRIRNGKYHPEGNREPICKPCFDRWNQIQRIDKGLPPIPLHADAYAPTNEDLL